MNETMTTALCRPSCVSVGGVDAGLPAGNGLCIIDGARDLYVGGMASPQSVHGHSPMERHCAQLALQLRALECGMADTLRPSSGRWLIRHSVSGRQRSLEN